jgi:hypothetical protein
MRYELTLLCDVCRTEQYVITERQADMRLLRARAKNVGWRWVTDHHLMRKDVCPRCQQKKGG